MALITVNSDDVSSKQSKMFEVVLQLLTDQKFDHLKEVYYSNGSKECAVKNKPAEVNLHHMETVSLLL